MCVNDHSFSRGQAWKTVGQNFMSDPNSPSVSSLHGALIFDFQMTKNVKEEHNWTNNANFSGVSLYWERISDKTETKRKTWECFWRLHQKRQMHGLHKGWMNALLFEEYFFFFCFLDEYYVMHIVVCVWILAALAVHVFYYRLLKALTETPE